LQVELGSAAEHCCVPVLVECDAEMVDTRTLPVARLDDDVHGSSPELDQPQPKTHLLELVPGDAGFEPVRVLAHPAVAGDQAEAELSDVARLDEPHLARDEVVMEELHRPHGMLSARPEGNARRAAKRAPCPHSRPRRRHRATTARITDPRCRSRT